MTDLNLTDYEFGFLVAKSHSISKQVDRFDGDYWQAATVIDVVHGRKNAEYDLNIWYNDEEDRICCTAYATKMQKFVDWHRITDGNTFTRLW